MKRTLLSSISIVAVLAGTWIFLSSCGKNQQEESFTLTAKKKVVEQASVDQSHEVGIGWSHNTNPETAIEEAITKALQGKKHKNPHMAIVFVTSGSDGKAIMAKAKELLGSQTKIFGGSSEARAVMTNKQFVAAAKSGYEESASEEQRGLVVMTVYSEKIIFGVGMSEYAKHASVEAASKQAVLQAIQNAGKTPGDKPQAILVMPGIGNEEETLIGIDEIVGKDAIILGGTPAGPNFMSFGNYQLCEKGVSLVVIYTHLPVGWTFEGGFNVKDPQCGTVTKVKKQTIIAIDNRPALDVYNEWLGGRIEKLYKETGKPDVIRDLLTLHPLYRRYESSSGEDYYLFSHPWPKDNKLKDRGVMTSTKIKVGEKICLSSGTWETLLNRIGNLPTAAKAKGNIPIKDRPVLAIGFICAGVLGTIPETERPKMVHLINRNNQDAPFIAPFTWGEQGHFPGIGNKHGNLTTGFLLIGREI